MPADAGKSHSLSNSLSRFIPLLRLDATRWWASASAAFWQCLRRELSARLALLHSSLLLPHSRDRPLCRVAGGSGAVAVFPLLVKAVSLANEYILSDL